MKLKATGHHDIQSTGSVGWALTGHDAWVSPLDACVFPDKGLSVRLEAGQHSMSEGCGERGSLGLPWDCQIRRAQAGGVSRPGLRKVLCLVYHMESLFGGIPESAYTSLATASDPGLLKRNIRIT